MAAPLARLRLLKSPRNLWYMCRYNSTMGPTEWSRRGDVGQGYYILLPEIPSDTAKTNPLLETLERETPPFDKKITSIHFLRGITKLAALEGHALLSFFEDLEENAEPTSFDSVFQVYEKILAHLSYASGTCDLLANLDMELVRNNEGGQRKINKIITDRWTNRAFLDALKELAKNKENLTEVQQRYVDVLLHEFFKVGFDLKTSKRHELLKGQHDLSEDCRMFKGRVDFCQSLYRRVFHHKSTISGLPEEFLQYISTNEENPAEGPWSMPLNEDVYNKVMQMADNRELRKSIYKLWNLRASEEYTQNMASNIEEMTSVRMDRNYVANLLGFDNHVDLVMSRSMAGNADTVMGMIYDMRTNLEPLVDTELQEMEDFNRLAYSSKDNIELWDVHYLKSRIVTQVFLADFKEDGNFMSYFPLEHVLESLFNFTKDLFGYRLEESHGEFPVWADGVRVFKVYSDEDEHLAYLFVDQYLREGMSYIPSVYHGRGRSDIAGYKPIAYLNVSSMNTKMIEDIDDNFPSFHYVDLACLPELAHAFGNALQMVLNRVPYTELSSGVYTEVDAQGIAGMVMRYFSLQPHIVQMLSKHVTTGESISEEQAKRLCIANQYMSSYDLMHDLYTAAFDFELHLSLEGSPIEFKKRLWPLFNRLPYPSEDMSEFSNTRVFIDTPGYCYAPIWTKMVAADIFESFSVIDPSDTQKLNEIGKRFRNTFLHMGGGLPSNELFRRFKGRDPDILPFLKESVKYRSWVEPTLADSPNSSA